MANIEKKSYPRMSVNNWFALRKKFRTTLPKEVTPTFIGSVLKMKPESAGKETLPTLKVTGIVDDKGSPTNRAIRWRDNKQYAKVCQEILEEVYPQELRDIASGSDADRATVQSWFANHLRAGESVSAKLTSFYLMLCRADPSEGEETPTTSPRKVTSPKINRTILKEPRSDVRSELAQSSRNVNQSTAHSAVPSFHMNIQIHISPESSAEQIDQIFSSMAKHMKDFMGTKSE